MLEYLSVSENYSVLGVDKKIGQCGYEILLSPGNDRGWLKRAGLPTFEVTDLF